MLTSDAGPTFDGHEGDPLNCKDYYLFLLELYVRKVSSERLNKFNRMYFIPTSVRFKFHDIVNDDDLEVLSVDPFLQPQAGIANVVDEDEIFNVGKSVLLAVDFSTITNIPELNLKVVVEKRVSDETGLKPQYTMVGTGMLDLSEQFNALWLEMLHCCQQGVTLSKTFDGDIELFEEVEDKRNITGTLEERSYPVCLSEEEEYYEDDVEEEEKKEKVDAGLIWPMICKYTGKLNVFVRMSIFGQTIVTDFNAPVPQDSGLFMFAAGKVGHSSLYKFRRVESCAGDFPRDSNENQRISAKCPVCFPEKHPCKPCEQMGAAEQRVTTIEGRSKYTTSSNDRGLFEPYGQPLVLKMSGLFDNGDGKKPKVTVADGGAAAKPGNLPNPNYDVFVLRIGKKGIVGVGEKCDIQLELKTPKGPERRPPIRYETREMQTDIKDEEMKDHKKKEKKKKKGEKKTKEEKKKKKK